ncbi:hypothetical protein PR202_ga28749 [Eleusine coracana subsp. coracana]|uniref:Uncharacterized protein n=1 Tax=Eleusine coracana subsp. coracana TaxID=191504 RepID=A0AAV5DJC3_ELECO|nr:hypothetical protein PR202_ga28749 [Eleusine coracana subsp. coracana]
MSKSNTSSNNKRRRTCNNEPPPRKQHLYVALDDWEGGYSIHKLHADDLLTELEPAAAGGGLPEPAALRLASPVAGCPMSFAAMGTTIVVVTNPCRRHEHAGPTLVYDTATAALSVGPTIPDRIHDLGARRREVVCLDVGSHGARRVPHVPRLVVGA